MTRPGKSWSLRRRLTIRVLGLVIGSWLATIALSALVLDHEMNEMFDEELQALVETTVLYLDATEAVAIPRNLGVQTNDGERVLRLLPVTGQPPPAPWPALTGDGFHDVPGWRILRRTAEGAVIEAAHSTGWRREEIGETALAFLGLALPLIAFLLWGLRRTTAEATAPVNRLARAVAARSPDDLSPVKAPDLPTELHPLAMAFDGYLGRIERLREAERDFVANAAHELRTPLAAVRARLELSADPDATATVPMIDGLTRRIERLLQLARSEAGVGIGRGPADLVRILRLLIDEIRPQSRHPIHFDDSDLTSLPVEADADALAILLRNLLENAVEHGTGEVRLHLSPDALLTIDNPAPATPSLAEARFERGHASGGQGLGLSIVASLARAMDVDLSQQVQAGKVRFQLGFKRGTKGS